ncbi:MAG: SDR family oxidoreductase [Eubacterium sp.]|nr:SDR family oxidoreductase [Eubacterium sp.]
MQTKLLDKKVAVITGAISGIGKRTAEIFAEEGAYIVLAARGKEKLRKVGDELLAKGAQVLCVQADVSKEGDCKKLVDDCIKRFGKLDILVNNAGIADKHRPITRTDSDWWFEVNGINLDSVFFLTKEALKFMEKNGCGSIINISSIGGVFGNSGIAYSASKSAVIGMTKNIAIQFAGKGIRCNAVCPGPTPTSLNTPEALSTFDSEFAGICAQHMDMSVPEAETDDQANAILFFASDLAKAVTGQIMIVDNGCTL